MAAGSATEKWTSVRDDGKKVEYTCQEVSPGRAIMTAQVEGEERQHLKKTGLNSPLSHADVEREFHWEKRKKGGSRGR